MLKQCLEIKARGCCRQVFLVLCEIITHNVLTISWNAGRSWIVETACNKTALSQVINKPLKTSQQAGKKQLHANTS